jgi:hypothetical protein
MDVSNSLDPNGSVATVSEILHQTNEMLDDMVFLEGNLPTGHKSTVRTGIPAPTWRQLYGFVQPTKADRAQVTDSCGMMEAYAEVDKAAADLNGNTNAFRLQEDTAFIEGMSQEAASAMFQANEATNPEQFTGLNVRFNDLSASNADNIIDAGGTGSDNASLWLIGWGPNTVHGIYPKGSKAGLQVTDKGQVTIDEPGGTGRMEGYRTHYRWDMGLTVRDWRYVVRIANIDRSLLSTDASTGANLPELMFEAEQRIPNLGGGKFAWYGDRTVMTKVMQQYSAGTSQSTLGWQDVGGRKTMVNGAGISLRRVDALAVDEARVV